MKWMSGRVLRNGKMSFLSRQLRRLVQRLLESVTLTKKAVTEFFATFTSTAVAGFIQFLD